jgi:hypothetical protein
VRRVKTRAWIAVSVGALLAAGIAIWGLARPDRDSETSSQKTPTQEAHAAVSGAVTSPQLATPLPEPAAPGDPPDSLSHYPVDLEDLRARLPNNRYWELGVPTKDPEVARARAERARRDNELFGRTQTGEATEAEIRAYYAERRRISEDYLELSQLVLKEKADQLPERDKNLFALSAKLHKDRLVQIDRDLADALARRRQRAGTTP